MKTKSFLAITLIFSSLLVFTGCRKGEDDPFLSLRSRTARLTGEWKLTSGELTITGNSSNSTTTTVNTYSESSYTSSSDGLSDTYDFSYNLTFDKKGTYKSDLVNDGYNETTDGHWHWLGRNRDGGFRNKEAIIMTALTIMNNDGNSSTYGGTTNSPDVLYPIKQLKNKELVLIFDESYSSSSEDYSYSIIGTITFEKQ